ncbi:MAG: sigma-54 dependent transcriptional regulator [Thioalkalivibrio sp.]|nr:sigma-54 dependent transcriptional regulator [Thioalkalivibrio sp.]
MKAARILVVDDEPSLRTTLEAHLREIGHDVLAVESATAALNSVGRFAPDIVLTDVMMPGMSGIELLSHLREVTPGIDVVLFTGKGDARGAIDAIQLGASDYLTKPLCLDETEGVIDQCLLRRQRARAETAPAMSPSELDPAYGLVGSHPRMVEVYKSIGSVARAGAGAAVLIRGETGTGKELIARAIHMTSQRANGPFVAFNCAAVPESLLESELFGHVRGAFSGATMDRRGKFEAAAGGSLFFDEIGDTTPAFQAKMLRVLQEREFYPVGSDRPSQSDVTIIAATHRPLQDMVEEGTFRQDLFYRLQVLEIEVPPLRERRSDIPLLIRHLAARAAADARITPPVIPQKVIEELTTRDWPGNVRELENVIRRAVVMSRCSVLTVQDIGVCGIPEPETEAALVTLSDVRASTERRHVQRVLYDADGNKSRAARILGVSRPTLNRLIRDYQLAVG